MNNKQDGGPAFPTWVNDPKFGMSPQIGITLRDYFAARVAASMFVDPVWIKKAIDLSNEKHWPYAAARWCYQAADAMLAERNK